MSWFTNFLTSSIGRKIIMSLTGLFLVSFLLIHLIGNLQLLIPDEGKQFNLYAKVMTTNPVIKTISYLLYFSILLHAVQGILLWTKNRSARGGERYAKKVTRATNTNAWAASSMGWLGVVILVFILIHLYQFWLQMKMGTLPIVDYDEGSVKNLYLPVEAAFSNIFYVVFYVACMGVIAMHLLHGFQSAFQTLGLNHPKYNTLIQWTGRFVAILIPLGFAVIPIVFFIQKAM